MTRDGIETLLERVAAWSAEDQEEFVRFIGEIESKRKGVYKLSDAERAAVRRGLAEMRAGQLASDEEVAAVFDRYR